MKKILLKIEKFFVSIALLAGILRPGRPFNIPKKTDYIGRTILFLLGLVIFLSLIGIFLLLVFPLIFS